MQKKRFFMRYMLLLTIFIVMIFIYSGVLLNLQFARADEFKKPIRTTYTRTFLVPAVRGEIFDRNGVPLVTNKNIYNIVIDGTKMTRKNYIGIIIDLVEKITLFGGTINEDSLPVTAIETETEIKTETEISYSYSGLTANSQARARLDRFLSNNKLNVNTSADELIEFLTNKYNLNEYMPAEKRDRKIFRAVLGICYEFERLDILAGSNTYIFSKDISSVIRAVVMENAHNYPGVEVITSYERVYHFPKSAPHILGRTGRLTEANKDYYLSKGYALDAIVGISGVESAFEEYLRGVDGRLLRTYDQDGNLISEEWYVDSGGNIKEPVPGMNIYLTIDIKLQQVAEYSLEKTIEKIHERAQDYTDPKTNGADANAGAVAAIDPETGEVLALATYPSYDIVEYAAINPESNNPFINRATSGLYEPGSVFKIVTSLAALGDGKITPNTQIYDVGKYKKFPDYQPECWRYSMYGVGHGYVNVTEALQVSCNCFYYDVGERVGIERLNEYSRKLGFGERTGIEIGETSGVLASPEYAESRGAAWMGGDLLQASIGQSYNLFSPLQMANMLGTVVNGGDRYQCRLLLYVKEYGSDEIYYAPKPNIIDSLEVLESDLNAVRSGMRNVVELGTAASLFNRFPANLPVGGKTGTVQITSGRSNNATFVAFAPYDKPQISMSVVIEKGAHGSWAGFAAEDVLGYYFGLDTFEESMDLLLPEPEEEEIDVYEIYE